MTPPPLTLAHARLRRDLDRRWAELVERLRTMDRQRIKRLADLLDGRTDCRLALYVLAMSQDDAREVVELAGLALAEGWSRRVADAHGDG